MISTVCSPTAGDLRRVSTGASDSLMGLLADFTGPTPGYSISRMLPRALACGLTMASLIR